MQIWNEELSPTRRYTLIRVDEAGNVMAVRVAKSIEIVVYETNSHLTRGSQAKRRGGRTASALVSLSDTTSFIAELAPAGKLSAETLRALSPVDEPVHGKVLSVWAIHAQLLELVGREMEYSPSERQRGERLHRLACETLGLGSYADTGRFPDIVCQALEVKLQTAPTIDLGLVSPDSEDPAVTLSPRLRHCDTRYLVAYAVHDHAVLDIEDIVVLTGADFFQEFQRFGGLVQNKKLQFRLPAGFFGRSMV